MSKNRNRLAIWLVCIVLAAGALVALAVGFPIYLSARAGPLHPQPQATPSATRSDPSPQWSEAVDRARRIVRTGLAEQNLPGLSVAVGVAGDIVWAEGFGWADIETRLPMTPDTRFKIGTASTVLTSAAVGVLLERDQLELDEEIQTYVPQFPKTRWPVTLRQVMGHVAGLGSESEDDRPLSRQRCERPVDALRAFADRELLFEPGTEYRYSKYGWILVSAAVEAAADQPFLTFMREQVFQPLGMDDTGAESTTEENPEAIGEPGEDAPFLTWIRDLILEPLGIISVKAMSATAPERATFYVPGFGPNPVLRHGLHVMRAQNLSCYAGAMAFFSTPSDLVRFGLAMNNATLLQPATVERLQMSQQLAAGQEAGTMVSWISFRERGIVVAVMSNISSADTSFLASKVAEAFTQ